MQEGGENERKRNRVRERAKERESGGVGESNIEKESHIIKQQAEEGEF